MQTSNGSQSNQLQVYSKWLGLGSSKSVLADCFQAPTSKSEEWKYTFRFLKPQDSVVGVQGWTVDKLVETVDLKSKKFNPTPGQYVQIEKSSFEELSNQKQQSSTQFKNLFLESEALKFVDEPLVIRIKAKSEGQSSVKINLPVFDQTQSLGVAFIKVEPGAQAFIHLQSNGGVKDVTRYALIHIEVGDGASIGVLNDSFTDSKVGSPLGQDFLTFRADLGEGSQMKFVDLTGGKAFIRKNLEFNLSKKQSEVAVHGMYGNNGSLVSDIRLKVNHLVPHTTSHIRYNGILNGSSRGVYNGQVFIARDAQKSNSDHLSRVLLMSNLAESDAKPELDVYADDVKAAHGSTVGQLNQEEVFYLMSRGVPKQQATQILSEGFFKSVLSQISDIDGQKSVASKMSRVIPDLVGAGFHEL